MRRVFQLPALLGLAFALSVAQPVWSQTESLPDSVGHVQSVVQRGAELEAGAKWGEALTLYEDALREYPNDPTLTARQRTAHIHYDLGRRYSDSSFRTALLASTDYDASKLLSEVLLKVQTHHVETPDWRQIVYNGWYALDVALGDKVFVDRHLPRASKAQIDSFRSTARRYLQHAPITGRNEARDAVAGVARLADQQLNLSPTSVILEFTCGITSSLDDFSSFLTSNQLRESYSQIEGNFVGLGIELKAADGTLLLVRVISGSPAQKGGLLAGDKILSVDGQSTNNMSTDQAADLLQGKEGTSVDLTVATGETAPRLVRVRREQVDVPSVDDAKIIDPETGVAYFKLVCFQKTTTRDIDAALWKLYRAGMRSLIVDLRGNPGGLLTTCVEVVDKFVEQGTIVSTRGRNPSEDYTYRAHKAGTWRVPLVVLIDEDSASASEIFAGAIRDHRRGTLLGTRSYGKGSVQGIFPLNIGNTGIRLTTAKFYSPNGHAFHKVGVEPTVEVRQVARPDSNTQQQIATTDDPVIAAALRVARDQIARRATAQQ